MSSPSLDDKININKVIELYKQCSLSKDKVERAKETNVLHIAAVLGLPNFVREIVDSNPELAFGFDKHGLTPCHLAVACDQASVVRQLLLSKVGVEICCLKDEAGFLPIHAAIMTEKYDVLQDLWSSCTMSSLQELTPLGDNILHLAVKSGNYDAFQTFSSLFSWKGDFFSCKDANGNTVLHIAVIKGQLEIVKALVGHKNKFYQFLNVVTCHSNKVEVNTKNGNGLTALDIFDDLRFEDEEKKKIGEVIRNAGGRKATELVQEREIHVQTPAPLTDQQQVTYGTKCSLLRDALWTLWRIMFFDIRIGLTRPVLSDTDREICNTLMVVATLIAAMTFQGVMSPPGGLIQEGQSQGQAVLQEHLHNYLFYDTVAFVLSLIVILLTIYMVPRWRELIKLAMLTIWASVLYTTWSFLYGVSLVYPHLATNIWILALTYIGGIAVLLVGLFQLFQLWYSLLLKALRTSKLKNGKNKIIQSFIAILGAVLFVILYISIHLLYHFFRDQQNYRSQLAVLSPSPSLSPSHSHSHL